MDYKSLLYVCECPPSTAGGLSVIARELFSQYDPQRLHVLCCESKYSRSSDLVKKTHLPCLHIEIPRLVPRDLRPRRVFAPMIHSLNSYRIPRIVDTARRAVRERGIEALFVIPGFPEFTIAAYQLHRELGLPMYVFETDDWEASNKVGRPGRLSRSFHRSLLSAAEKLWLTSPAMVEIYREKFGVDASFLFHFVDLEKYLRASAAHGPEDPGSVTIVYTGAINAMFMDTLRWFCGLLNRGLTVAGRRVRLQIYSGSCPAELQGPNVAWRGFVPSTEIPRVLAGADVLLIGISFTQDPRLLDMVKTSMYTKTVDYLASNRPVLVVSPPYTAEVDYFGQVTAVVSELNEQQVTATLTRLVMDRPYREEVCRRGVELVRKRHSLESLDEVFLKHFRREAA